MWYTHTTQSRDTHTQHNHVIHTHITVTWYTQHSHVTWHTHTTQSRETHTTVTWRDTPTQHSLCVSRDCGAHVYVSRDTHNTFTWVTHTPQPQSRDTKFIVIITRSSSRQLYHSIIIILMSNPPPHAYCWIHHWSFTHPLVLLIAASTWLPHSLSLYIAKQIMIYFAP